MLVVHVRRIDRARVVVHHSSQSRRAITHLQVLTRPHLREDPTEARTEAGDSFVRVLERQLLPDVIVSLDCLQIDKVLLTAGAGNRPKVPLAEHGGFILVVPATVEKLEQLSDLLGDLIEATVNILFSSELAEQLLDHLTNAVEDGVLQVEEIGLVRLRR